MKLLLVIYIAGCVGFSLFAWSLYDRDDNLMPTIVANKEIIWDEDLEIGRLLNSVKIDTSKPPERRVLSKQVQSSVKVVKIVPKPNKTKNDKPVNNTHPPVVANKPSDKRSDTCKSMVRIDLVNHAYKISNGDMKFIGTIASESMFDVGAVGDGGSSIGLCQIHKGYNKSGHEKYKSLKTDFEKLEYCYSMYAIWEKKGLTEHRLYGSRVWKNGIKKLAIQCE